MLVSARSLCALSGITYRQCDYWTGNGWLHPSDQAQWRPVTRRAGWAPTPENPGSGAVRLYPLAEVSIAYVMRLLISEAHLGVMRSHLIARGYVEGGERTHALCKFVDLSLAIPIPEWDVPPD